jgi:hypothetical protein
VNELVTIPFGAGRKRLSKALVGCVGLVDEVRDGNNNRPKEEEKLRKERHKRGAQGGGGGGGGLLCRAMVVPTTITGVKAESSAM